MMCCRWNWTGPTAPGNWGNPNTWIGKAEEEGYPTGNIPKVNSVFVWPNHVGWVFKVTDTEVYTTEMQCGYQPQYINENGPKNADQGYRVRSKSYMEQMNTKYIYEKAEDKTEWHFETDGDTEGWTAYNVEAYSVGSGIFYIDPDASDPHIASPTLSVDASNYNVVLFRMASNAPDGIGAVYFKTQSEDYYSESKKVDFTAANEPGGSANYYDYPVYMYHPKWTGTITGIRIDPSDYGTSGTGLDTIGFDYVKLTNTSSVTCNNAQHIDDSGNITVSPNESFTIWFKVKNTGSSVWSEETLHRLGWLSGYEPFPEYSSNLRIYLFGIQKPGETKTWSTVLTAPFTPGTYPITWRMVQEQVQWFGDQMTITVTVGCPTPATPANPNPPDGATNVSIDTDLDWSDCTNADSYDVYFGTSSNPPYHGTTTSSNYSLPTLSHSTHYYWKIVAKNNCGNSTPGPVWDFTTASEPNHPPNTPSTPSGPSSGYTNTSYSFSTSATDPDGDPLTYRFDWGDGNISSWGASSQSHSWGSTGNFCIKAQAKDNQATSSWSSCHYITITSPPPPNHNPELSSGDVSPDSGDTSTTFTYTVNYYDQDGDSPSAKYVYIDGSPHTMSLYTGSASNGTYRYQTTLSAGSHNYYFYFTDGNGGSDRLPSSGTYSGPSVSACTYSISPPSKHFGPSGGTGTINVTTQDGCSWTAVSHAGWITITAGSSGTGSGIVYYSVSENSSKSSRTGTITIADKTFTVTQSGVSTRKSIPWLHLLLGE